MKSHNTENLLVALDVGTTKICVLVAQRLAANSLHIVGIGKAPSHGVSRGVVTDIAQTVHAIKQALKEAELMAGCTIESVYVGISGAHIHSLNSQGMVPIKQGCVKTHDIAAVLAAARAVVIPEGQQIVHILPQYYTIDGQQKVTDPLGMFGVRLEANVHIITGSIASVQNLVRCCEMAGVKVADIILEPLASADAVLSADEKELGVGILDIGGGTSDFAAYQNGSIRHTKVFGIAGNHFTHDIALCLRTTIKDAERVKHEFGSTIDFLSTNQERFEVEMVHGQLRKIVSVNELVAIIESRAVELMYMVNQEISKNNLAHLIPAGIVLTGGGSLLRGIEYTAQSLMHMPVRIGNPHVPALCKESLDSPLYATGYGLLVYMLHKQKSVPLDHLAGPLMSRILWRMKSWVSDFF
ncbi:cell division protein FtsA [Candidatus Dependentiae bacterium]|nr:cell division protein FtsA [Candidatus Dependentiae bacterium]